MNFLRDKYGKEKFNLLINCIEESDNPLAVLENIDKIKSIVGDDYFNAIKFLKFIIKSIHSNTNAPPISSVTRARSESDFNN
jgi:hypothetical protein